MSEETTVTVTPEMEQFISAIEKMTVLELCNRLGYID